MRSKCFIDTNRERDRINYQDKFQEPKRPKYLLFFLYTSMEYIRTGLSLCIFICFFFLFFLSLSLLFISWRIWMSSQRKRIYKPWELIIKKFPLNLWRWNTKYANVLKYVELASKRNAQKMMNSCDKNTFTMKPEMLPLCPDTISSNW